ncbi:MAG: hypothetical protein J5871_02935 [Bacteroidales bacterium]|nr:hypothetical protein [Bacteroidales bacterium]
MKAYLSREKHLLSNYDTGNLWQRIVSVRVGDVAERLQGLRGCRVCDADETALADAICAVLREERPSGDTSISLDNDIVADAIYQLYKTVSK